MSDPMVRLVELRFYDPDDGPAILRIGTSVCSVELPDDLRAALLALDLPRIVQPHECTVNLVSD